jgi:hypothetical protein
MKAFPATGNYTEEFNGMDLRDYFAAKAMQAILKDPAILKGHIETICQISYFYADEMMKARK